MIPEAFIVEWRAHTRWATDDQIEHDLVLSRALVQVFSDPLIASSLALRVGRDLIARLPGEPWKGQTPRRR
jgi:hypothetical protein